MNNTTVQVLSMPEISLLAGLKGKIWESLSGDMMLTGEFAWKSVTISTENHFLELSLLMQTVEIGGEMLEIPNLSVLEVDGLSHGALKSGSIYFQNQHSKIEEIWIVRDKVTAFSNGELLFKYQADVALAFKLGNEWFGIARTSHIMDAFYLSRSIGRESIKLPIPEHEWEADLLEQFEFEREWIEI